MTLGFTHENAGTWASSDTRGRGRSTGAIAWTGKRDSKRQGTKFSYCGPRSLKRSAICRIRKLGAEHYLRKMFKFEFCLPTMGKAVPVAPEWFHEIKFDGYRLRIERDGKAERLITRGGHDWAKR